MVARNGNKDYTSCKSTKTAAALKGRDPVKNGAFSVQRSAFSVQRSERV